MRCIVFGKDERRWSVLCCVVGGNILKVTFLSDARREKQEEDSLARVCASITPSDFDPIRRRSAENRTDSSHRRSTSILQGLAFEIEKICKKEKQSL